MEKLALITIITVAIFSGCVKQKNCDCDMIGKFVYFENGEEINYCGHKRKRNATVIIPRYDLLCDATISYPIYGAIPEKFRTKDTLNVAVCIKTKELNCFTSFTHPIYKLTCIEKVD